MSDDEQMDMGGEGAEGDYEEYNPDEIKWVWRFDVFGPIFGSESRHGMESRLETDKETDKQRFTDVSYDDLDGEGRGEEEDGNDGNVDENMIVVS